MLERLLPTGVLLLAGIAWQFLEPGGVDKDQLRRSINTLNIYLLIPCLVLRVIGAQELTTETLTVILVGAVVILICLGVNVLAYGLLGERVSASSQGAMVLAGSFGNGIGFALPVVVAVYGEQAAKVPILYTLGASVPIVWTLGVMVALRHAEVRAGPMWQELLRSPPLFAVLVALGLRGLDLPLPALLDVTTEHLAQTALPLVSFVVGLSLNARGVQRAWSAVPALLVKTVVGPLLALPIGLAAGFSGATLGALLLTAGTASFNVGIVLSDRYDLDVHLYAVAIAASAALFFALIPVWTWLVTQL